MYCLFTLSLHNYILVFFAKMGSFQASTWLIHKSPITLYKFQMATARVRSHVMENFSDKTIKRKVSNNSGRNDRMLMWKLICFFFKKNGSTPASFSFILSHFQANNTIFTTNKCEKCPFSFWRWESNPQWLEHKSSHITTSPGLPPLILICLSADLGIGGGRSGIYAQSCRRQIHRGLPQGLDAHYVKKQ